MDSASTNTTSKWQHCSYACTHFHGKPFKAIASTFQCSTRRTLFASMHFTIALLSIVRAPDKYYKLSNSTTKALVHAVSTFHHQPPLYRHDGLAVVCKKWTKHPCLEARNPCNTSSFTWKDLVSSALHFAGYCSKKYVWNQIFLL